MSQIYNENTKRPKPKENQLGILGISSREFMHFAENSAESLGSEIECCWDYVSVFDNTPKKLLIFPLEHVYMRPEVKSHRFEISNRFEMYFRLHGNLHGDFAAATFQTMSRL